MKKFYPLLIFTGVFYFTGNTMQEIKEGDFAALRDFITYETEPGVVVSSDKKEKLIKCLSAAYSWAKKDETEPLEFLKSNEFNPWELSKNPRIKNITEQLVDDNDKTELDLFDKTFCISVLTEISQLGWDSYVKDKLLMKNFPEGRFDRISEVLGCYTGQNAEAATAADKQLRKLYLILKKHSSPVEYAGQCTHTNYVFAPTIAFFACFGFEKSNSFSKPAIANFKPDYSKAWRSYVMQRIPGYLDPKFKISTSDGSAKVNES